MKAKKAPDRAATRSSAKTYIIAVSITALGGKVNENEDD